MAMLEDEIAFEFYRSSAPGGQKKNTTDSALRARHLPTGIVVIATAERSQHQNKQAAVAEIARRLAERKKHCVPRVPTRPSKASKEKRIQHEKKRAAIKRSRGSGSIEMQSISFPRRLPSFASDSLNWAQASPHTLPVQTTALCH